MQILLTNDDGIYAPGLAAMERALRRLGEVCVVAPAVEQSGVGHSITFLSPLMAKEVFDGERRRGWAVEGSPADCVKLAVSEFCKKPDLVVSGINGGLNLGINVLYSGTVAGATEGAVYGLTSVAVSLEYDEHAQFDRAAEIAVGLIEQLHAHRDASAHHLYNMNIPTSALDGPAEVRVVPMSTVGWSTEFDRRVDPKGRRYYWATGTASAPPDGEMTDYEAWQKGFVTITPLRIDRTEREMLADMRGWELELK